MSSPALKRKATELAASEAKKPKPNASITSFFGQPKVKAVPTAAPKTSITNTAASSAPSTPYNPTPAPKKPFDKEAWLAKLSDEQKELLKLEIDTLHESWLPYLAEEIASKEFVELKRFLKREVEGGAKVFPPMEDVYSWYVQTRDIQLPYFRPISKRYGDN